MNEQRQIDRLIVELSMVGSLEVHKNKVVEEMFELGKEIMHSNKLENKRFIVEELIDVINTCEVLLHKMTGREHNNLRIKKLEKGLSYYRGGY